MNEPNTNTPETPSGSTDPQVKQDEQKQPTVNDGGESPSPETKITIPTMEPPPEEAAACEAFVAWESDSIDIIKLRRCYVDAADNDLEAAVLLSQLVFWFLPSKKDGLPRTRRIIDGRRWFARIKEEWWKECRLTPNGFACALEVLESLGLVTTMMLDDDEKFPGPYITLNFSALVKSLGVADSEKQKKKEFVKPTLDELTAYIKSLRCSQPRAKAAAFYEKYESNGWRVGDAPMRSWPKMVDAWKRNWDRADEAERGEIEYERSKKEVLINCDFEDLP